MIGSELIIRYWNIVNHGYTMFMIGSELSMRDWKHLQK